MFGDLVQTTAGKWITPPPPRCPNGHTLGANQVLVGHVACLGHGGGGHTTWTCQTCDQTVYGPPLNSHCLRRQSDRAAGAGRGSVTSSYAAAITSAARWRRICATADK